jgi:hypothetical protein
VSLSTSVAAWAADLSALDKLVLLSLADHADSDGHCWPSVARLSDRCGMHRSASVMRSLAALKAAGHITVEAGSGRLNRYRVHPVTPKSGSSQQPVAQSDQSPPATTPVADSNGSSRPQQPYRSPTATQTSQESLTNRPERARPREPVAQSNRSPIATSPARERARPEGLERILTKMRNGFAAGARR